MATQVSDTSSKSRLRGGAPDDLSVIAQRAQAFTNASGTAIALSEGNQDEIICRARAGSNAPEVGTAMRVEGSFTGLCIQSGKELRCDDAETDTRVDTAAIRALGIRSMVVIPIRDEGRVVGVLAVFAPTAHAFTITHVAVLKTMADQISAILQRERKPRDEGFSPEPLLATPAPVAKPVTVSAPTPAMPPAVVIKPAAQSAAARPLPAVPKIEPVRTTVVAADIATSPARKRKETHSHSEEPESKSDYRISFGTLDSAATQGKKSDNRGLILGVAAIAAVAVLGVASYIMLRKPAEAVQPQPASAAVVNPPVVNPASAAPGASTTASVTTPPPAPAAPATSSSETSVRVEKSSARSVAAQPKREEPQVRREEPEPKREETVALSTGPSRISGSRDNSPAPDAAPSIAVGSAPSSGSLSTLANPVSVSTPSMITQSELEPIKVTRRVPPIYPPVAKQRRLSGSVIVEGVVGLDGKITGLKLDSGPPIFRDAAFDAVKQWQFTPARLNGKPIEQPTKIRLDFNPQQ